jgi:hypothetical protein
MTHRVMPFGPLVDAATSTVAAWFQRFPCDDLLKSVMNDLIHPTIENFKTVFKYTAAFWQEVDLESVLDRLAAVDLAASVKTLRVHGTPKDAGLCLLKFTCATVMGGIDEVSLFAVLFCFLP